MKATGVLSERTLAITTYAMCTFANFGSIAIQIGGISAIVPEKRSELASLGIKTMACGLVASWMTASIASIFFMKRNLPGLYNPAVLVYTFVHRGINQKNRHIVTLWA